MATACAPILRAQILYWDANGATSGAGGTTPTGTWGTDNFWGNSAGTAATTAWTSGGTAVFSAASDATGSYTITVSGTQTIGGLTVENGTPTMSGGTLALSQTATFDITGSASISSTISGATFGLTKIGTGSLTLSGTTSSYTGTTSIQNGSVFVTTLGMVGGGNSSLGAPTTAAEGRILMGSGSTTGSLRYEGAGSTTDRIIVMNGAAGGATLSSNGTGPIVYTSALDVAVDGAKTLIFTGTNTGANEFRGAISDGTNPVNSVITVNKNNPGRWILSGPNTYTGGTTINAGTLQIGAGGSTGVLPGNVNVTSGAALDFNRSDAVTYAGLISGSGQVTQTGTGTLTLAGANTYTGKTLLNAGTLALAADSALGTAPASAAEKIVFNGGELLATTTLTLSSNRSITLTGAGTLSAADGATLTYGGIVSGAGAFAKDGAGTLTLGTGNTYTGTTALLAGTTAVSSLGSVGTANSSLGAPTTAAAGTIKIGNVTTSATLRYGAAGETTDRILALNGSTGGATIDASGTGAIVFTSAVSVPVDGAKTLTLTGTNTDANELRGSIPDAATAAVSLTKAGTGNWLLSGTNTYTGVTTVNGGVLTLSGGSAIADTSAVTLADVGGTSLSLLNNETIGSLAGGGTTGGNVSLGSATLTTGGDNTSTSYAGIISGTGGLTKSGTGTFTLSGTNTFTGATTVNAGTLALAAETALGDNPASFNAAQLTLDGGTLSATSTFTLNDTNRGVTLGAGGGTFDAGTGIGLTIGKPIAGTGALTKTGAGTLTLSATNSYTGVTAINAGTLSLSAETGLGANPTGFNAAQLTLSGGTLRATSTFTLDDTNRGVTLGAGGGTFDVGTSTALTIGKPIAGTGTLTKTGSGQLTLSATNSYTGTTTINAGTLILTAETGLGSNPASFNAAQLTLNGGTLRANSPITLNDSNRGVTLGTGGGIFDGNTGNGITISNPITGTGALTKIGPSTLTLSGTNSYTGATTVNAGSTLALSAETGLGANPAAFNAAQLTLNGSTLTATSTFTIDDTNRGVTLGGGGATFDVGTGFGLTISNPIAGSGAALTKTGAGTLTLSGTNTFNGITSINGGTLAIGAETGLGNGPGQFNAAQLTLNGGTLRATSTFTLNDSGRGVTLGGSGGTFDAGTGVALSLGTPITGTGALTKTGAGTLTLSPTNPFTGNTDANTFTGITSINGGTLSVAAETALGNNPASFNAAQLTLNSGTLSATSSFTLNDSNRGVTLGSSGGTFDAVTGIGLTISNPIAGSGALTKTGAGTLTLSATNTFTGIASINGGTLSVAAETALGNNPASFNAAQLTLNGGTLSATSSFTLADANRGVTLNTSGGTFDAGTGIGLTISNAITGTGALTKTGSGTLTLSGTNTFTGATTINAGTLHLAGGTALADSSAVTLANATDAALSLVASETIGSLSGGGATGGNVSLGANTLTAGADNTSTTFTGVLSGAGGALVKSGTGTFTLAGTNSYTGMTTLSGGTLSIGMLANGGLNSSIGASSNAADNLVLAGGTLRYTGNSVTTDRLFSVGTGGATLEVATAGQTLTFSNGGAMAFNSLTGARTLTLSGAGNGSLAAIVADNSGATSLTKTGTGTWTLSGVNTFTGATAINAGTLALAAETGLGANPAAFNAAQLTLSGGTLSATSSLTLDDTNRGVTLGAGGGTFDAGTGVTLTVAKAIAGTGSLTKTGAGTLALSAANTFTGAVNIYGGTLSLSGGAALANTSAVTLANTAGATLSLSSSETIGSLAGGGTTGGNVSLGANTLTVGGTHASTTYSGSISGSTGSLTKNGTGTLTLAGNNTFTGTATINAGTLELSGGNALANTATVSLANVAGATLLLSSNETIGSLSGGGTTGGHVSLGAHTLTVGSGTYSGAISGSGSLTITSSGLTLQGANSYTGGTLLSGGTINFNSLANFGTGQISLAASLQSTLQWAAGTTTDISSRLAALPAGTTATTGNTRLRFDTNGNDVTLGTAILGTTGTFILKSGAGTLTLPAGSTFTRGFTLSGGTLAIATDSALGTVPATAQSSHLFFQGGGTLRTTASMEIAATRGTRGPATFQTDAGTTLRYGGLFTSTSSLTKLGTGTLALSGDNSIANVTISEGVLQLGDGGTVGTLDADSIVNNASLVFNRSDTLSVGLFNKYSGTGSITQAGNGTLNLAVDNPSNLIVSSGTLWVNFQSVLSATNLLVTGTGTFLIDNASATFGTVTLQGGTISTSGTANIALTSLNGFTTESGTVSANLTGSSGLTQSGAGTTTLSSAVTYSGTTTVSSGTLALGASNRLPSSGALTVTGTGTFDLGSFSQTIGTLALQGGSITGTGGATLTSPNAFTVESGSISAVLAVSTAGLGLTKTTGGTVTLSGLNTYTGPTTINAGALTPSTLANGGVASTLGASSNAASSLVLNGGTLLYTGAAASTDRLFSLGTNGGGIDASGSGLLTLSNTGSIGFNNQTGARTLTLSGTGSGLFTPTLANDASGNLSSLTKSGSGTWTLSGAQTYTGTTAVSGGTLVLGASNRLADTSSLVINGGKFDLGPFSETVGAVNILGSDITLISSITGSGTLTSTSGFTASAGLISTTLAGTGVGLTVNNGNQVILTAINTYTGPTTINGGAWLQVGNQGLTGSLGSGPVVNNGSLWFRRTDTHTVSNSISGTGVVSQYGTATLSEHGTGTLILTGANTYSGGTYLGSGTLAVGHDAALGTGLLTLLGGTLTASGAARTLANNFSLSAPITLSGTNPITFTGAGTLNGLVSLTVGADTTATLSGAIGQGTPGLFTKLGAGRLVFAVGNTYTGGTAISGGTATISNTSGSAFGSGAVTVASGATLNGSGSFTGALTLNGTISPGNSPGTQATGSQTWNSLASYDWELNRVSGTRGNDPGWDWLNITGSLTIASTSGSPFALNLISLNSSNGTGAVIDFNSSVNSSYTIATATGGIIGFNASAITINTAGFSNALNGGTWSLGVSGNDLNLMFASASAIPEPGTYAVILGGCAFALTVIRRRRLALPKEPLASKQS